MAQVLIVEDNEFNLDMLSRRLTRRGWDVLAATGGRSALEFAAQHVPDLILMDLNLPDLDGWTVTSTLKCQTNTERIPVIALTAHAMVGDREKTVQSGCDEFETKPVNFTQLLQKMNELLEARSKRAGS